MFYETCANLDELNSVVTNYIQFCIDSVIPTKRIKVFPNDKPWMKNRMKEALFRRKRAFQQGDLIQVKAIQKEIKQIISECKHNYKLKIERQMKDTNVHQAWKGLYTMVGKMEKNAAINTSDDMAFANELNCFYGRFDTSDFSTERNLLREQLCSGQPLIITEEVRGILKGINPRKAPGPDGVRGYVLRKCREQLNKVLRHMFQLSVDTHYIPKAWKTSPIVPVPKISNPKGLNDYRPVALTSLIIKSLERIVLNNLLSNVQHEMNALQFA